MVARDRADCWAAMAMPNARQVHLLPVELLEALRVEDCVLDPGDLGENVLTAGLDLESLPLRTILKLDPKPPSSLPACGRRAC